MYVCAHKTYICMFIVVVMDVRCSPGSMLAVQGPIPPYLQNDDKYKDNNIVIIVE